MIKVFFRKSFFEKGFFNETFVEFYTLASLACVGVWYGKEIEVALKKEGS